MENKNLNSGSSASITEHELIEALRNTSDETYIRIASAMNEPIVHNGGVRPNNGAEISENELSELIKNSW